MRTKTTYIAHDKKTFNDRASCLEYEAYLDELSRLGEAQKLRQLVAERLERVAQSLRAKDNGKVHHTCAEIETDCLCGHSADGFMYIDFHDIVGGDKPCGITEAVVRIERLSLQEQDSARLRATHAKTRKKK